MYIDIVSIFPDYFAPLDQALIGKAREGGTLSIDIYDLRRWTGDLHRTVDDTPYGGGGGMVMLPQPWGEALDDLRSDPNKPEPRLVVPTPSGKPFT
ncbi:MAG TPA: tRNA (guanosine(37)-N1)-methyltransferase TrmD, partial [Mycobacteriales bacterium]|nr:tRNA (guanosine(37)-N1)-methyltransferase TrmD [Mycobacteriales bacterium]